MTRVYNIIEDSEYYIELLNYKLYFSSLFNLNRFKNNYKNYIMLENRKISNRYLFTIDLTEYLLLSFYKKIEKRGFRVYYKNKLITTNNIFIVNLSR